MIIPYCPACEQSDALSTPRRPVTIRKKRTTRLIGSRFCERCNLIIPTDSKIKFWNGREIIEVLA